MPEDRHEDFVRDLRAWEEAERGGPVNPWLVLAQGAALGVILFLVSPLKFVLRVLATLIHELGHAAAAWIFGVPAVPAFDFVYGGGVTIQQHQSRLLLLILYIGAGALLVRTRRNRVAVALLGGAVAFHLLCVLTRLDDMAIVLMGHGAELLFAAIFLYRGLTGAAVVHSVERPLYAGIGCFLLFLNVELSVKLLTSAAERALYASAKGGALEMDFVRLGRDFLHVPLPTVAAFHLVACLLAATVALLLVWQRPRWQAWLERLRPRGHRRHGQAPDLRRNAWLSPAPDSVRIPGRPGACAGPWPAAHHHYRAHSPRKCSVRQVLIVINY